MLRFCIVGAGFIGGTHAQALAAIPEARVSVVCSRSQEKAAALAQKAGAAWVTDYRQAVARDDVDVVCVCTASAYAGSPGRAAAGAPGGKPLDVTLERWIASFTRWSGQGKLTCIFPCATWGPSGQEAVEAGRLPAGVGGRRINGIAPRDYDSSD
jgi:threonine dehydrogenase-like Zn-dependent dehydrogenase